MVIALSPHSSIENHLYLSLSGCQGEEAGILSYLSAMDEYVGYGMRVTPRLHVPGHAPTFSVFRVGCSYSIGLMGREGL